MYSWKVPSSQKPGSHSPLTRAPVNKWRGSYGSFEGANPTSRLIGSLDCMTRWMLLVVHGIKESQRRIASTPLWSLPTNSCVTPFGTMMCGPPSWSCVV
jgi:hypothetical protein